MVIIFLMLLAIFGIGIGLSIVDFIKSEKESQSLLRTVIASFMLVGGCFGTIASYITSVETYKKETVIKVLNQECKIDTLTVDPKSGKIINIKIN